MKTVDLNVAIFRKYSPEKKIEIVKEASEEELFAVSEDTIVRCVKEAGTPLYSSKPKKRNFDKELYPKERVSNGYGSQFYYASITGLKAKLTFTFDGIIDNEWTDSDGYYHSCTYSEFKTSKTEMEVKYYDTKGRVHHHDFIWQYDDDKVEVIRQLLFAYIYNKYSDKLNEDGK